jgi:hypothetical protein
MENLQTLDPSRITLVSRADRISPASFSASIALGGNLARKKPNRQYRDNKNRKALELLDKEAKRLGVPRQSIIQLWVSERLKKAFQDVPTSRCTGSPINPDHGKRCVGTSAA